MKKRITSLCLIVLMLCAMCGTSVFAAELPSENMISPMYLHSDYFTGGTGTMNSIAGSQSKIFNSSSGSISANARVTNVDFYPKGTWKIYIYNRGSAFTDVSTATARITVNYGYDSYS